MKNNETELTNALDHGDPKRRGFLTKMIAGGAALPLMSTVALGEPQQGGGKGKGGKGKGGAGGAKGKGKGGAGKGDMGQGGGRMPEPYEMAARMITQFDKDGDKALNAEELTAALTAMRERMTGRGKGIASGDAGAGKGKGGAGKGKGADGAGKGKGKGKGSGSDDVLGGEGVVPKRPGE